jgi:hypothetical protein
MGRRGAKIYLIDGIPHKTCSRCNEIKPITLFHQTYRGVGGKNSVCKECRNIHKRLNHNPEKHSEYMKESREIYKERYNARNIINNALRAGLIEKPTVCEICGKESSHIEGHHVDYSKPYEVHWLCKECHSFVHSQAFHNPHIK